MGGVRATLVAGLTAGAVAAPAPAGAVDAGCLKPATRSHAERVRGRPAPPLVIGDSVMVWSVPLLGRAGFDADARPCRSWADGDRMVRRRARHGTLPRLVVVALGANGPFTVADIARTLRAMGPKRTLALLTARWSGDRPGYGAEAIHEAGRRFPGRVRVLDWVSLSTGHPGWFAADGVHLGSQAGVRAYTRLIESAALSPASAPAPTAARRRRSRRG